MSRSRQMARIRGADTRPEVQLRRALRAAGLTYRVQLRVEGVRPDVVFPKAGVVVFVDGCFWHGCPTHYVRPRGREGFWADKLARNVARDRAQTHLLERAGWRVVRVWEHELAGGAEAVVARVRDALDEPFWLAEDAWRVVAVQAEGDAQERWFLRSLRDPTASREEARPRSRVTLRAR